MPAFSSVFLSFSVKILGYISKVHLQNRSKIERLIELQVKRKFKSKNHPHVIRKGLEARFSSRALPRHSSLGCYTQICERIPRHVRDIPANKYIIVAFNSGQRHISWAWSVIQDRFCGGDVLPLATLCKFKLISNTSVSDSRSHLILFGFSSGKQGAIVDCCKSGDGTI